MKGQKRKRDEAVARMDGLLARGLPGWEIKTLAEAPLEIIDGDRGKNYPKQRGFSESGHCLFLNTANVTSDGFNFSSRAFISSDRDQRLGKGKLVRDDVVLTTRGTVGNSAHFDESVSYDHLRINSGMVILRPSKHDLYSGYLYAFVRSQVFLSQVNAFRTGSAQPQLPIRVMERIKIALPPFCEQRAIAGALDAIDKAIERTEAVIAATARLRDSLLHELLTRGVPGWHSEWKEVAGVGTVPACWEVARLGQIVKHVGSGVTPRGGKSAYSAAGVTFLRSQNVHFDGLRLDDVAYIPPATDESMQRSRVRPGDVLLNITGASIGRCTVVPFDLGPANVNQHVCIIRVFKAYNATYVSEWLSTARSQQEIDDMQVGQSRQGLNYEQVRQLTIACPPRPEQDRIVEIINGVKESSRSARGYVAMLQAMKASTADALLTGRLRTSAF